MPRFAPAAVAANKSLKPTPLRGFVEPVWSSGIIGSGKPAQRRGLAQVLGPAMLFGRKRKLYKALESLAIYNDKGIDWARHSPGQVQAHRAASVQRVKELVEALPPSAVPPEVLEALQSGDLATDMTGRYAQLLKGSRGQPGGP